MSSVTIGVGRTRVSHVSDGVARGPRKYWFTGVDPAEWMPAVGVSEPDAAFTVTFGGFVVTGDGHVTVVDAGYGHRAHEVPGLADAGEMPAAMAALGIEPGDVDQVVMTHLHSDHCGWLIKDDEGALTFPNATVFINEREVAYWTSDEVDAIAFNSSVAGEVRPRLRAVKDAGRLHTFDGELRLSDAVSVLPTHGHTPGHVSVLVADGDEAAILAGDVLHHPAHVDHPCWLPSVEYEPAESTRSRKRIAALAADRKAKILAPHFPLPTIVDVDRGPDGHVRSTLTHDVEDAT
ncbi:glyoxylase-like metal-dependent hydrolase (beta-lactamase superfamily II) [Actinomadura pelletieri DSM 43383]|uniref:Glyoxylase-like metal-dependent hydrolase (Beta-lactamase superfamily II) n=1 Tax=Actinomadura pelletieri DSM 43383 TaxID=1120940 RepID=A0A495QY54_9ACTN|nr:MBL fold metallo-hydrolase [Actinomadura pelletieri]RKS78954.1 glyoxylase-like metal-dependent hydrolase (beta-lactamase superfamily II) [Actinomadura pelletieri DSM 43383]